MSTHHANSSGHRSGRGQRRNRDRSDDYRPKSRSQSDSAPAPAARVPEKLSWWQKILAIFKPGKSAPAASAGRPAQSQGKASVTSRYPDTDRAPRDSSDQRRPREPRAEAPASAPSRPARKPEAVEVTTPKLYIGNLSFDATEADLSELFAGTGIVQNVEIVTHKQTEKSKGFAFVTMASIDEARRAVDVLHDKEFMGRKLVVSGAKTPTERS